MALPGANTGYEEFTVTSSLSGKPYRCRFHTLTTGISTRHSDTVDTKFLVNGKGVVVALPHAALFEFRRRHDRSLTDAEVIQIAALFLTQLIEQGNWTEVPLVSASPPETLELAEKLVAPVPE